VAAQPIPTLLLMTGSPYQEVPVFNGPAFRTIHLRTCQTRAKGGCGLRVLEVPSGG